MRFSSCKLTSGSTTSGLALVPILRCANYCASKAALHHYILCLREQLKDSNVKVVELFPPAVQSKSIAATDVQMLTTLAELHDEKHQPEIKNGGSIGMPLNAFINEAYEGLAAGKEEVAVEKAKGWYEAFEPQRQKVFYGLLEPMKAQYSKD